MCLCECLCTFMYVSILVHVHGCVSVHLYVSVHVCMPCVYEYVSVPVCVNAYAHVWVCGGQSGTGNVGLMSQFLLFALHAWAHTYKHGHIHAVPASSASLHPEPPKSLMTEFLWHKQCIQDLIQSCLPPMHACVIITRQVTWLSFTLFPCQRGNGSS